MKKCLLFVVAALMSLMANAQLIKLEKAPAAQAKFAQSSKQFTPAVATADNIWGYYLGGFDNVGGLGTESAGTFKVAIFVPGNGVLKDQKIEALNLPVNSSKMSNVSVWGGPTLSDTKSLFEQSVASVTAGEYNKITLATPVDIPVTGMYVGYTFTIASATSNAEKYPIGVVFDEYAAGSLYLGLSATANLDDYSAGGYGVSALQLFVSNMNLAENAVVVSNVTGEATAMGGKGTLTLDLSSDSSKPVSSIGYTLIVNGVQTTGNVSFSPAIPAGLMKSSTATIEYTAPESAGSFPASIAINTVNGVENEAGTTPFDFTVNTVSRVVPRMTVVEEYTGTGCGWCPRGWVGMESVKKMQSDKALVIAWHRFNSSDAMYQASYASIPFDGAPQCTVDRKVYPDPYYGENEESIMECVNKYNTAVPTVDITELTANFSDSTNTKVVISASTEFLTNTQGYTIAFALTADSLTGTTTAWKQSNYYYQSSKSQAGILPAMSELGDFCSGGKYGKSSVQIVFNDALIGSSYNSSGRSLVPAFTTGQAGDVETSEYTLNMPTKAALVSALQYDKIYVTALVIDNNGFIANAARSRVLGVGEKPEGDNDDVVTGNGNISPISDECQLMGEAMSPNCKYVVGSNFGVGPAIWNVEAGTVKTYSEYEEGTFHAVNNSGLAVGHDGMGEGYAIAIKADGTMIDLYYFVGETQEVHDEFLGDYTISTGDAGTNAFAVSEDGKTIAGFYFKSDYTTYPCIWNENGERTDLPVPTEQETGYAVSGAEARWMTPDAKIIAGFVIDDYSTWPAIIWRLGENGTYTYDIVSKDFFEIDYQMGKPYMVFTPGSLSENGEWLSVSMQPEYDGFDFSMPMPAFQAGRLNLNTGKLEVCEAIEDSNVVPTGIANNGAMIGYSYPAMEEPGLINRNPLFFPANSVKVAGLQNAIGNLEGFENVTGNVPCCISGDGLKVQGFCLTTDADIFSYVAEVINPTGIETLSSVSSIASAQSVIYNLSGQQVRNANGHGLYIINGKKILK